MCAVSFVGDYWKEKLPQVHPWTKPYIQPSISIPYNTPTREEFEALKREMQELKKLLEAAKNYDEATGQPDCQHDEKVALIKKFAEFVGVDMKDLI